MTRNSSIVFEADYDPYGNMVWSSGSFKPRYTFSTKRSFEGFGAYYYGYRWYLPELGRWMQKDPLGMAGGSANEYSFCVNNPVSMIDPIGLKDKDTCTDGGSGGRSGRGSGGRGGGSWWKWPVDVAGKVWNAPNTALGLAVGTAGALAEPIDMLVKWESWDYKVSFGHNAIQFENNPLVSTGITLGNAINYGLGYGPGDIGGDLNVLGNHEEQHTYQGQILGPLYTPANLVGGVYSTVTTLTWHDNNFMDHGPMSHPPNVF